MHLPTLLALAWEETVFSKFWGASFKFSSFELSMYSRWENRTVIEVNTGRDSQITQPNPLILQVRGPKKWGGKHKPSEQLLSGWRLEPRSPNSTALCQASSENHLFSSCQCLLCFHPAERTSRRMSLLSIRRVYPSGPTSGPPGLLQLTTMSLSPT